MRREIEGERREREREESEREEREREQGRDMDDTLPFSTQSITL